jgi:hypothetical protein
MEDGRRLMDEGRGMMEEGRRKIQNHTQFFDTFCDTILCFVFILSLNLVAVATSR